MLGDVQRFISNNGELQDAARGLKCGQDRVGSNWGGKYTLPP